jgi:hypothetical protein
MVPGAAGVYEVEHVRDEPTGSDVLVAGQLVVEPSGCQSKVHVALSAAARALLLFVQVATQVKLRPAVAGSGVQVMADLMSEYDPMARLTTAVEVWSDESLIW